MNAIRVDYRYHRIMRPETERLESYPLATPTRAWRFHLPSRWALGPHRGTVGDIAKTSGAVSADTKILDGYPAFAIRTATNARISAIQYSP